MKRPHLTLYGQILLWFFLNLALVAAVLVLVLKVQFRVDPRTVLGGRTHEQFEAVASILSDELREAPREDWEEIVGRFSEAYRVDFAVYRPGGRELLQGEERMLPDDLLESLRERVPPRDRRVGPPPRREEESDGERLPLRPEDRPGRPRPRDPLNPEFELPGGSGPGPRPGPAGRPSRGPGGAQEPGPRGDREPRPGRGQGAEPAERVVQVFYVGKGGKPKRYWAAAMVSLGNREHRHPPDAVVAASAESLGGNEIFFDWRPWLWAIGAVLLVSALIWLPFVGRVSRRLRRLTSAAESISEGNFEVEVASKRTDELGRLSRAVQSMANRLDDYMKGQKRFLGDIAHELCSPLARLRMSLGVLEGKIPEADHGNLASLNEEAEELSQLVNELLDFSRASIAPAALPTHEVCLGQLLEEVAQREGQGAVFKIEAAEDLQIWTNRDLLRRALANVVRNANRYAGDAGPIELRTEVVGNRALLQVQDRGPGIPEEWIERVFEPFSRPERARTREGGGAGLGLAIAKTCVEGLGGKIRAWNREGGGLVVELEICAKVNSCEG